MKKHDLIKAIGITFLVFVILSWIIPTGTFSSGEFTEAAAAPLGIGDLFLYPIATLGYQMFTLIGIVIIAIGGLYGVLNKTGAYANLVNGLAKKFKGKEKTFLVISILFFAILSSLTSLSLALFTVIPFVIAVILTLGFSKLTAFLSTFGAILVGGIGYLLGYNMDGYNYVNYFFGVEIKTTFWYSLVLLVLAVATLMFFVLKFTTNKAAKKKATKKATKTTKKEEKVEEKLTAPLYDNEVVKGKSPVAMAIIFGIFFVLVLVAMFNWSGALKIEFFNEIHKSITTFEINGYTIFAKLLGSISAFGYWGNYELAMVTIMTSMLIAWVYKLKVKTAVDAFVKGAKEMFPVAIVAVLASILLYVVNSTSATFFPYIADAIIGLSSKFNYFAVAALSGVGSVIYNSFPYLLYSVYDPMTSLFANDLAIISMTMQSIYSIVMLVVPTSIVLVMGLKFLDISYKEYLKNVWKLLIALLVIVSIAILIIATMI